MQLQFVAKLITAANKSWAGFLGYEEDFYQDNLSLKY